MVEGTPLLRVQAGNRLEGSNPFHSATCPHESVLPIRLRPDFSVVFDGYAGGAEHWQWRPKVFLLRGDTQNGAQAEHRQWRPKVVLSAVALAAIVMFWP